MLTRSEGVFQCLLGISEQNFMLNGMRVRVLKLNQSEGVGFNAYSTEGAGFYVYSV